MAINYSKEQRTHAKKDGSGLLTLSYTSPKGLTYTVQSLAKNVDEVKEEIGNFIKVIA